MDKHLYLSLLPESLVASMLDPEEFGAYMAGGTKKQSHEQAVFFELDADFRTHFFDIQAALDKCVARVDGTVKASVYVGIYRVLENIPLSAIGPMYLTTREGVTLRLDATAPPRFERKFHLYHELCPVHPLITSRMDPVEFTKFITDPRVSISMPRICFADLRLGELAKQPVSGKADEVMCPNVDHLRSCLEELVSRNKMTKTFDRLFPPRVLYRSIESGFFVGDQTGVLCYPMPSRQELETTHSQWWESSAKEVRASDRRAEPAQK
jgi:hypothetical protein